MEKQLLVLRMPLMWFRRPHSSKWKRPLKEEREKNLATFVGVFKSEDNYNTYLS